MNERRKADRRNVQFPQGSKGKRRSDRRNDCRRSSPRVSMHFWIRTGGEREQRLCTGNLGVGGIDFPCLDALTAGSRVEVTFYLPESTTPITVEAEILRVWANPGGKLPNQAGARFINIDYFLERQIARFVEERDLHERISSL